MYCDCIIAEANLLALCHIHIAVLMHCTSSRDMVINVFACVLEECRRRSPWPSSRWTLLLQMTWCTSPSACWVSWWAALTLRGPVACCLHARQRCRHAWQGDLARERAEAPTGGKKTWASRVPECPTHVQAPPYHELPHFPFPYFCVTRGATRAWGAAAR